MLDDRPITADQITIHRRKTGLTSHDPVRSSGGYTLYARQTGGGVVDLIDIEGRKVHRWDMPVRPGRDAVILENGNLGYNGSHTTSLGLYPAWDIWHGGDFYEVTPDGDVVWRHEDPAHHHDAAWLANGNLLYTAAAVLPAEKAARLVGGMPVDRPTQSDIVREVDRSGKTVWEWCIWDHIDPADLPIQSIFDQSHWPMINGLWETREGLVMMSLRTTSGIIAVDKTTGRVVWHAGPDILAQQHTPIEMEDGSVLCFDNGNWRPGSTNPFSRALQFDPKTMQITWSYVDQSAISFFSPFMGGAERLWNGNTLICESAFGRLFEVTPDGQVVWEYVIPDFASYPSPANQFVKGATNSVFRAHRYKASALPWL